MAEPEQDWIDKYRAAIDSRPPRGPSALVAGWQRFIHALGFVSRGESGPPLKSSASPSTHSQLPERHRTEVHLTKNIASEKSSPAKARSKKKAS